MRALATDAPCISCGATFRVLLPQDEFRCGACVECSPDMRTALLGLAEEWERDAKAWRSYYRLKFCACQIREVLDPGTDRDDDCPDSDTMAGEHGPCIGKGESPQKRRRADTGEGTEGKEGSGGAASD